MRIVFHPDAYEEMLESARFYERRSSDLGSDFLAAIEEATHRIQQFPDVGPADSGGIRKQLVPGFPFTLLYELQKDRIFSSPP